MSNAHSGRSLPAFRSPLSCTAAPRSRSSVRFGSMAVPFVPCLPRTVRGQRVGYREYSARRAARRDIRDRRRPKRQPARCWDPPAGRDRRLGPNSGLIRGGLAMATHVNNRSPHGGVEEPPAPPHRRGPVPGEGAGRARGRGGGRQHADARDARGGLPPGPLLPAGRRADGPPHPHRARDPLPVQGGRELLDSSRRAGARQRTRSGATRNPIPDMTAIAGYLAFYRDRMDAWSEDNLPPE